MSQSKNRLLVGIVLLQLLTLAGQWVSPSYTSTAQLQIPDAGAQRNQIIEEIRGTNARLDRLMAMLDSGKVQVRTANSDDRK